MKNIDQSMLSALKGKTFGTILVDPPWQFTNKTRNVAPEHKRLDQYYTMSHDEIMALPICDMAADPSHLYLWVPNALLQEGLQVIEAWGFDYKTNIVWQKVRKDGEPDRRGIALYFRNTTEMLLFGIKGKHARTLSPGRSQVNVIKSRKRGHSRKPDEQFDIIEACSWGPYLELFAQFPRKGWEVWGRP